MGATAAYAIVAVISSAVAYTSSQQAASAQKKQFNAQAEAAEAQAQMAQERAAQEATLERERIEYEANLARENAEYEIGIATESAEFTEAQKNKQYQMVRSAQIAGAAAAGLIPTGSTWAVMQRTTAEHATDINEVRRALDIFSETRTKEAEEVAKGGEFGLSQFLARSTRETEFEVTNRMTEARMFRQKGSAVASQSKYATAGLALSVAGAGFQAYGGSKLTETQRYGILAGAR